MDSRRARFNPEKISGLLARGFHPFSVSSQHLRAAGRGHFGEPDRIRRSPLWRKWTRASPARTKEFRRIHSAIHGRRLREEFHDSLQPQAVDGTALAAFGRLVRPVRTETNAEGSGGGRVRNR